MLQAAWAWQSQEIAFSPTKRDKSNMQTTNSIPSAAPGVRFRHCFTIAALILAFSPMLRAQVPAPDNRDFHIDQASLRELYTKYEFMIPMRDGVKLFTAVYAPKDNSKPYP